HARAVAVEIDEATLCRRSISASCVPHALKRFGNLGPRKFRRRMCWCIPVARFVRIPPERTEVRFLDGKAFSAARHAWTIERRARGARQNLIEYLFLRRVVEIARPERHAWRSRNS